MCIFISRRLASVSRNKTRTFYSQCTKIYRTIQIIVGLGLKKSRCIFISAVKLQVPATYTVKYVCSWLASIFFYFAKNTSRCDMLTLCTWIILFRLLTVSLRLIFTYARWLYEWQKRISWIARDTFSSKFMLL